MNLRPRNIDFSSTWKDLHQTIEQVLNLQQVNRKTWDYNFSDIYFICVSIPESHAASLYLALSKCLNEHILRILNDLRQAVSDDLLKRYNQEWFKYHKAAISLHNLFLYLNKQIAKEQHDALDCGVFNVNVGLNKDNENVGNLVLGIWKEGLLRPLSVNFTPFIVGIIMKDRLKTGNVDSEEAKRAILSFVDVNRPFVDESHKQKAMFSAPITAFYQETFERAFFDETITYYTYLTNDVYAELNCSEYMEKVIAKMEEEKARAERFVHSSSVPKLERLCLEHLVQAQIHRFNSVCSELVCNEQLTDLYNMHFLLKPLENGLSVLLTEFEQHIRRQGMKLTVDSGSDASLLVANIQTLHEKFAKMVREVFREDQEFVAALDRALQHVVNHREDSKMPPRISERLNRYIDSLLRKTAKGMSETEIDTALCKAITIFRYIDDKDLFQKYYSKMLSARLISNISTSMDCEEAMITKMKEACGYEFTSKLSRMFTDIGVSRTLNERFSEFLHTNGYKLHVPLYVMVLQAGAWPLSPVIHSMAGASSSAASGGAGQKYASTGGYSPPPMLQTSLTYFEKFYGENHTGRKLNWLYGSSTAEVKLNYLDKTYVISMNVYQLSILMLFMDEDTVPMQSIIAAVDLPVQSVLKYVKGFIDTGILKTKSETLDETTDLDLNFAMTSKRLRFKIAVPPSIKTQEKVIDTTCNTLQQDRKYYMECTIVRIMKARKLIKHSALVEEVIKQTAPRFVPDVTFIKKTIESLIEKLYLQRTDQHDEYQYLA